MKIKGYRRPDGKIGIRNHVLLLPTSVCSTQLAMEIAAKVAGCTAVYNSYGCCQVGGDFRQTYRTLLNTALNPNVGAVIVVGLGCEGIEPLKLIEDLEDCGKPLGSVVIQEEGGTLKAFAKGCQMAREFAGELSQMEKTEADLSDLIIGLECGGSDTTSGLASNPAVGAASDLLVAKGATTILSETTEMIGAEHILARRAKNQEVAAAILDLVRSCEKRAEALGEDIRGSQPTPGNIQGGLTTIEEKSLGCLHKAGHAEIQGVLEYAEIPAAKGLYIMDTPGQDIVSVTGMAAGGAQIVIFTTGRGTPTGNPITPVIKITGNKATFQKMQDNIDLDTSLIIEGKQSLEEAGEIILQEITKVANGKLTKAEQLNHREFSIYKIAPTF